MAVQRIPDGYSSAIPYLAVDDAAKAIDFYKQAFGATERVRMPAPGNKIGHAEIQIGNAIVMISDPFPQASVKPPKTLGGTTVGIFMYVEDVDSVVQDAVDAGATVTSPVEDMFWGDRFGQVQDPFGHQWQIATHVKDVPPAEMEQLAKEAMANMGS
jgi:PhnB protein